MSGTYPNPTIKPGTNTQVLTTVGGVAAWAAPPAGGGGAATSVGVTPPGSPTDGQLWYYSDAAAGGGQLYIRYNDGNSTAWVLANPSSGGAPVTVSDTAPVSPVAGALWWNSVLGALFLYYQDPNTSQWVPASPSMAPGSLIQTVSTETGAVATGTTIIPFDDTIPQITEGNEYMTLVITPKSATSKLIIEVTAALGAATSGSLVAGALFQDATANALAAAYMPVPAGGALGMLTFMHSMTSGTTSATTFRFRAGPTAANTMTFNGFSGARIFGGVMASSIVIQEVAS